ncbi:MAG: TRAP transporter large permease [Zetaproteobacteria bacterium]|nr:MAG: TRAP transporter large permease [Zetaproteobacteria bacterium]
MIALLGSLAVLVVLGTPIAYALGLSALLYFVLYQPGLLLVVPQRVFSGMDTELMIALPLFVLMGAMMNQGGLTARLVDFSMLFVGRLRGGLGMVCVMASMIFGGISGSSVADAASIGAVLIPEMEQRGYSRAFAGGITVAASTMGMIIPPSIPMVIYAFVASESVGRLFLAGAIPGILIGLVQMSINAIISRRRRYPVEAVPLSGPEILSRLHKGILPLLMPVFVVGSVVIGLTTATEAAGVGVLYAFGIGILVFLGLRVRHVPPMLRSAILSSANVMVITAFSCLYTWILALERIPDQVAGFLIGLNLPLWVILLALDAIILAVGFFVDVAPAIILLTPVFMPALKALGVSPIQFGAILIVGMAIGLVTPPVGMCLNVASTITKLDIVTLFRASIPFLIGNVIILLLVTFVPAVSLWLPSLLMD